MSWFGKKKSLLRGKAFFPVLSVQYSSSGLTLLSSFFSTNKLRELAFGPDSDPTVRGVALYFNISEAEVTECTPQQAKRFRWKKNSGAQEANTKISVFDTRECFTMIRPYDRDAFQFATDILKHRLETVKAERLTVLNERFEVIKILQKEKDVLRESFLAHKRSWINWCWPISAGRQTIDDDTRVPPVDAEYAPIIDCEAMVDQAAHETEVVMGSAIQPIWESFVNQTSSFSKTSNGLNTKKGLSSENEPASTRRRLSIFARLEYGEHICENRSLPHINKGAKKLKTASLERQSEKCWKALMLKQENTHQGGNEWKIVQEHFQNSRSKKVLKIIQN
jgi:hypothetical protein